MFAQDCILAKNRCSLLNMQLFEAERILFIWCRFQGLWIFNKRWTHMHLLLSKFDECIHFCVFTGLSVGVREHVLCVATSIWAFISFLRERTWTHASDTIISSSPEHAPDLAQSLAQLSITLARTLWKEVGPLRRVNGTCERIRHTFLCEC